MDILQVLLDQKSSKLSGNLYEYTAVNFSYNTNKIEGSTLSEDDTRNIFHNNTLLASGQMNIDDIIEMKNQLSMFDYMLDIAKEPLTEDY